MKNIKRALSLVLALAMVMSMMTMGMTASAAPLSNFSDADKIVNVKEVTITSGLGIFAGTGNSFDPTGTVTRAQMATIIVKMLRGNDFNANNFKGGNKFSDTAAFEGGWAEGYINACVQLGVVAGYGDGTFKPGKAVTTAEALTMIINALGVDAGPGQWPMTIMSKAEEMKLYGDLKVKPGTDSALTRDQLAVLVYEGLCYSPSGKSGYTVDGVDNLVFDEMADALVAARYDATKITEIAGGDSLAQTVYEMNVATGFITANQATDAEATMIDGVLYNVETGLDMIGHYVTVYYSEIYEDEDEPGEVFCIIDESTVVTVEEEIDSDKEYKAAFGKEYEEAETALGADNVRLFSDSYADLGNGSIDGYVAGEAALPGKYIIHEGTVIAYVAPVTVYASKVLAISTMTDRETITLRNAEGEDSIILHNAEDDDEVVEYSGIAVNDYVTYTVAQGLYVLEKVNTVTGTIAKANKNKDGVDVITVNGKEYTAFADNNNTGLNTAVNTSTLDFNANYALYVAANGKYIGYETVTGGVDLATTVFLMGTLDTKADASYGTKAITTKARGINMEGEEILLPIAVHYDLDKDNVVDEDEETFGYVDGSKPTVTIGFYTVSDPTDKDLKSEGLKALKRIEAGYDKEDNPIYYATRNWAQGVAYAGNGVTIDGGNAFKQDSSRFFILEGTVDQAYPLETNLRVGNYQAGIVMSRAATAHYLMSRSAGGARLVEVCVLPYDISASSTMAVYVSEANKECVSRSAEGYVYTVYKAANGAATDIVLDNGGVDLTPGFYFMRDAEEGTKTLSERIPAPSSKYTERWDGDGHMNENYFYNNKLVMMHGDLITTQLVNGTKVMNQDSGASATIVDTRDEDTIEADGVGTITSMDQIVSLWETHPNLTVMMDICYNTNGDAAKTIFVTSLEDSNMNVMTLWVPPTAVDNTVASNITTLTAAVDAIVVRSANPDHPVGSTMTLAAGTRVTSPNANDKFNNSQNNPEGQATDNFNHSVFVTWAKNADAPNGYELTIHRVSATSDADYTLGFHNLFLGYEDGVMTTVDAHLIYKNGTNIGRCYTGMGPCAAYQATGATTIENITDFEAKRIVKVADNAKIIGTDGSNITMNDLIALYDNGNNDVVVSYYCLNGGNKTDIIIVDSVTANEDEKVYAPANGELVYISTTLNAAAGAGGMGITTNATMLTGAKAGEKVELRYTGVKMPTGTAATVPAGIYLCNVNDNNCLWLESVASELVKITEAPEAFVDFTGEIDDEADLTATIAAGDYFVFGIVYDGAAAIMELRDAVVAVDAAMLDKMSDSTTFVDESGNGITTLARMTAVVNKTTALEGVAYAKVTESAGAITAVTVKRVDITDADVPTFWSEDVPNRYNFLYAKANVAAADGTVTAGSYQFYSFENANLSKSPYAENKNLQYNGLKSIPVAGLASAAEKPLAAADRAGFYVVTGATVDGVLLRKGVNAGADHEMGLVFGIHRTVSTCAASKATAQFTTGSNPSGEAYGLRLNFAATHATGDACFDAGVCKTYTSQNTFAIANRETYMINVTTGDVKIIGVDYQGTTDTQLYGRAAAFIPAGSVVDFMAVVSSGYEGTAGQFRWANVIFVH